MPKMCTEFSSTVNHIAFQELYRKHSSTDLKVGYALYLPVLTAQIRATSACQGSNQNTRLPLLDYLFTNPPSMLTSINPEIRSHSTSSLRCSGFRLSGKDLASYVCPCESALTELIQIDRLRSHPFSFDSTYRLSTLTARRWLGPCSATPMGLYSRLR